MRVSRFRTASGSDRIIMGPREKEVVLSLFNVIDMFRSLPLAVLKRR